MKRLLPVLFVFAAFTLQTISPAYSDGRNLDYGENIRCNFVNLKIEGNLDSIPNLENIKIPPVMGGGTWDLSNLKLDAETVGDGRLDIEFRATNVGWYFQKVEGPRNTSRDYSKLLAILFYQKSIQPDYYKAIFGKNDVHPFRLGKPQDTEAGGKKFHTRLDTGMRIQLLVSSHGFISFTGGPARINLHATGPCGPKTKHKVSPAPADIRSRLLRIKKLEGLGLITSDEAARKRQELLDKF